MFNGVEGGGYYLVICLISMMEEAVTCLGRYDLIS